MLAKHVLSVMEIEEMTQKSKLKNKPVNTKPLLLASKVCAVLVHWNEHLLHFNA